MSNIKIFYTVQGQVIGDVDENIPGEYFVRDPAFIRVAGAAGVQLTPCAPFNEAPHLWFSHSEILAGGKLYEPMPELRNAYSTEFGSGILLRTDA